MTPERELIIHFIDCKYSKEPSPGARIEDLYVVCGQRPATPVCRRGRGGGRYHTPRPREVSHSTLQGPRRSRPSPRIALDRGQPLQFASAGEMAAVTTRPGRAGKATLLCKGQGDRGRHRASPWTGDKPLQSASASEVAVATTDLGRAGRRTPSLSARSEAPFEGNQQGHNPTACSVS